MARAEIPTVVLDPATGNAVVGASCLVKIRTSGAPATVFLAETGATTVTNPRVSDAYGRVAGWVERGSYQLDISGTGLVDFTEYWESSPAGDGAIDTNWIASLAVTEAKLAAGAVTSAKILDGTITNAKLATPSVTQVIHVRDEKAQSTEGGTFTSGAWQTRVLNTSKTNTITGASLGSNQITLPAGTYWVDASANMFLVDRNQARLYDTTGAAVLVLGLNVFAGGSADGNRALVQGLFTLTTTSVLELQHRAAGTKAANGFGLANNFTTEVYADVVIWKTA